MINLVSAVQSLGGHHPQPQIHGSHPLQDMYMSQDPTVAVAHIMWKSQVFDACDAFNISVAKLSHIQQGSSGL